MSALGVYARIVLPKIGGEGSANLPFSRRGWDWADMLAIPAGYGVVSVDVRGPASQDAALRSPGNTG